MVVHPEPAAEARWGISHSEITAGSQIQPKPVDEERADFDWGHPID